MLFGAIHCLTIFVRVPIISKCKSVNLFFTNSQFVRKVSPLCHQVLDLSNSIVVHQAVRITYCQTLGLGNLLEIAEEQPTRDDGKRMQRRLNDQRCILNVSSVKENRPSTILSSHVAISSRRQYPYFECFNSFERLTYCQRSRILNGSLLLNG